MSKAVEYVARRQNMTVISTVKKKIKRYIREEWAKFEDEEDTDSFICLFKTIYETEKKTQKLGKIREM